MSGDSVIEARNGWWFGDYKKGGDGGLPQKGGDLVIWVIKVW